MTCLFIGGCADGKRLSVSDTMTFYRVPHENGYDEYRAEKLAANGLVIRVLVEKNIPIDKALRMMIESYQVKKTATQITFLKQTCPHCHTEISA